MIRRLRLWFGWPCCRGGEWTQWKIVQKRWTRLPNIMRDGPIAATITEVKFVTTHQERRCTICGYTQQEKVEF